MSNDAEAKLEMAMAFARVVVTMAAHMTPAQRHRAASAVRVLEGADDIDRELFQQLADVILAVPSSESSSQP